MIKTIILILVAIIPVALLLWFTFGKDKIEKEPLLLLLRLFAAGMVSCVIALLITKGLTKIFTLNNTMFTSFIGVGFIEEAIKWSFVYMITWHNKEFDYKFDAIVYSIFVSLGFAFVENIGYSLEFGLATALLRAIISVPCHAFFAIYMGYYLGMAKASVSNYENGKSYFICSLLIPITLHGIYNYCLIGGNDGYYLLFIVFIITLYILSFKTINFASSTDMPIKKHL